MGGGVRVRGVMKWGGGGGVISACCTGKFDQTYLLTPRLLQTSYVNALILESRSIIISSFNFKEL